MNKKPEISQWPTLKYTVIIAIALVGLIMLGIMTSSLLPFIAAIGVAVMLVKDINTSIRHKKWVEKLENARTIEDFEKCNQERKRIF